jgi:small subunit ribosomal protein S4
MAEAKRRKGVTGEALLVLLERRFDNLVYRAGFASSRQQARQMIVHGHLEVNGRASNVPSMLLNEGDFVAIKEGRRSRMKAIVESNQGREVPTWLDKNVDAMKFQLVSLPNVEQIGLSIATNLIVEFYSR